MKVAKMNYRGIKDVVVVPEVFVCVDRSTIIKCDIHIWHTNFTCKSFEILHVIVNCLIIWYFGCYGWECFFYKYMYTLHHQKQKQKNSRSPGTKIYKKSLWLINKKCKLSK